VFENDNLDLQYFSINVRKKFNLTKPFLYLTEQLLKNTNIQFIDKKCLGSKNELEFIAMNTEERYETTCYDFSKCCNNMKISYR